MKGNARLVPGSEMLPASKAQEQLFFVQRLLGDAPTYHVPLCFELRGRLDQAALHRAIVRVVERHEALRTRFALDDDGLFQIVDDESVLDWTVARVESAQALDERIRAEAARPFDLSTGPLLRALLLERGERTTVLMLCLHHIVCDGWSVGIVLDEILSAYSAFAVGAEPDLPQVVYQYADYADWHNRWLAGPAAAGQLAHWATVLGGELPVLELPADRPSTGAGAPPEGAVVEAALPAQAVGRLRELAATANSTLFMALLAVYKVLLSDYTGITDVIVGVPVANRARPEIARTVGFFVNTVAVRTDLARSRSFRELLAQVRTTVLDAYDNQEVPFGVVVNEVKPARVLDQDPIFQALFMTADAVGGASEGFALDISPVDVPSTTAKFQLSVQVNDDAHAPSMELEYRADRFSAEWIARFAERFRRLVELVAQDPDVLLADLAAVPPSERSSPRDLGGAPVEPSVSQVEADDFDTPYVAPRDAVEEVLAEVWAAVLGRPRVGIDDNYFESGGDSIRSVQIVARAAERGFVFPLRDLLVNQSIRELAPLVSQAPPGGGPGALEPFALISEADRALLPPGAADAFPLAALQAGMLYHSDMPAVHALYHDVASYLIRAPYAEAAWAAAVEKLLGRHELLRSAFALDRFSEPLQIVYARPPRIPITFEDLRALAPRDQPAAVERRFVVERDDLFDWEQAPLIRLHVQRLSDENVQLWICEHHAIVDGWSGRMLFGELLSLYLEALGGPVSPLPAAPVSHYRSFVALERAAARDAGQLAFWTERLAGFSATPLPVPRAGGPADMRISEHEFEERLSTDLAGLAGRMRVPVRIVLLAAHLRVMALLGGTDDVVSGAVYNGRLEEPDGDRVVGLFLNTLPFRCRIGDGSWSALIEQVAETDGAIQPNRRFPLAEIQRHMGGAPLFETFFNYTHFHNELENPTEGLQVLAERGAVPTSFPFGAEFFRDSSTDRIGLALRYDASRFADAQVERYFGYYLTALHALVADPGGSCTEVELLSDAELEEFARWNDTARDYGPPELLDRLIGERARSAPDAVAVVSEGATLSYRALDAWSNRLAHLLIARGVRPGDRVGVCIERSAELVVSLLAILKAGAAYVPLDPDNPVARLTAMARQAQLALVLTSSALASSAGQCGAPTAVVESDAAALAQYPDSAPDVPRAVQDPAYLIFTSGSTGQPKAVTVSHRAIGNRLVWMQEEFVLTARDRVLQKTPLSFDVSVWEFFWPLMQGARLVLASPGGHREPEYLIRLIRREAVTVVHFVPSMLRAFLEFDDVERCESLRYVMASGEALGTDVRQRFHARCGAELVNLYGPTEAAVDVSYWRCRPDDEGPVPIGRPIANIRIHVLDGHRRRVPAEVAGELHIGGVGLAEGYHGRPELTAERFVWHTWPDGSVERLYSTGDLVRRRADGVLDYLGRTDHQVKIRGIRLEPGEIEAVLSGHEGVRAVAVLHRVDRLAAYFVPAHGAVDAEQLRAYLAERLPEYMIPAEWTSLPELPLTLSGKVDRGRLPVSGPVGTAARRTATAPGSPTERRLVQLWRNVLGTGPIGVDDSFSDLGGNSLLALNLVARIRSEFGFKLPVADLLAYNTVSRLAQRIDQRGPDALDAAGLLPIRQAGSLEPLWLIHPSGGGVFCYTALADALDPALPVWGVVSEGSVSGRVEHRTVEQIAENYVEMLSGRQPDGPVRLTGWSFGAILAYEMACRLRRRGREVALLCMIDVAFPNEQFDEALVDQDIALLLFLDIMQGAGVRLATFDEERTAAELAACGTLEEKLRLLARRLSPDEVGSEAGPEVGSETSTEQLNTYFNVFSRNLKAHSQYRPGRYAGTTVYVEGTDGRAADSAKLWRAVHDGAFHELHLEAGHYELLKPPFVLEIARAVNDTLGGGAR